MILQERLPCRRGCLAGSDTVFVGIDLKRAQR
jgi:hypothetical protein